MGGFENLRTVTMPVGAAIAQAIFVVVDAAGEIVAAGNGAQAIGVTLEGVTAQEFTDGKAVVSIAMITAGGKSRVKAAAAAITRGDNVASDAAGNMVTAATGDAVLGIALEASAAATQELITTLLGKNGLLTP